MKVPFALPDCGKDEIQEVTEVIKSGWLTTSSRTLRFEKEFAEHIGARYCLAVNSGTAALHLGLEALGITRENKVIVPIHTFSATAEVVRYLGADPVFVDVDRSTFCITPEVIEKLLDRHGEMIDDGSLKAIIPVHLGGHPCDMDGIMEVAQSSDLRVLEDAAHAFPAFCQFSSQNDESSKQKLKNRDLKMVGTIGDVTCFSFYATKTITTAEGGMLATDDDRINKRVQVMRLHGINKDIWNRFSDTQADWSYDVIAPGFKYNMPDITAALGIHQLRKAEQFRKRREIIAKTYYQELVNIPGLILPKIKCSIENHSWHLYVVLIEPKETVDGINRDQFIHKMKEKDIGTSVHYIPLHRMTYYRKQYGLRPEMFPNSEWVFQRCVSLPIYSAMADGQVEYVVDSIREILKR